MYENITKFIGKLTDCGKWVNEGDTPQFAYADVVDEFLDEVQDFLVFDYDVVLDQIKEKLSLPQISADVDASLLNEEEVLSLITGIVAREKFISGILASYLRSGAMDRWLERLKELDEDESRIRKIKVFWSEKLTLDEAIKSHISLDEGIFYVSFQNGDDEQSLMLGSATYSPIREHLLAQKEWWEKAVFGNLFVRIGKTDDIEDALSALLKLTHSESNQKTIVENVKNS